MSVSSPHRAFPKEKLNDWIFIGVAWAGVALSFTFFVARIAIRVKVFGRLYADDGLVLFAWLVSLINTTLHQLSVGVLDETYAVLTGQLSPPPVDFPSRTEDFLRQTIAEIVLFYSGLWAVKLSFLVVFKRLGHNVRHQKRIWWTVLAMTGATYLACLATVDYRCLAGSYHYVQTACTKPSRIAFQSNATRCSMIMDVLSDVLIILIPINILWKVQINLRQKLALAGVFCITVFVMIFAIIRGAFVDPFSPQSDATWLFMWSNIELAVSIIVACLASFRALFTSSNRPSRRHIEDGIPNTERSTSFQMAKLFSRVVTKPPKDSTEENTTHWTYPRPPPAVTTVSASKRYSRRQRGSDSQEPILPLDEVLVQHEPNASVETRWKGESRE